MGGGAEPPSFWSAGSGMPLLSQSLGQNIAFASRGESSLRVSIVHTHIHTLYVPSPIRKFVRCVRVSLQTLHVQFLKHVH